MNGRNGAENPPAGHGRLYSVATGSFGGSKLRHRLISIGSTDSRLHGPSLEVVERA